MIIQLRRHPRGVVFKTSPCEIKITRWRRTRGLNRREITPIASPSLRRRIGPFSGLSPKSRTRHSPGPAENSRRRTNCATTMARRKESRTNEPNERNNYSTRRGKCLSARGNCSRSRSIKQQDAANSVAGSSRAPAKSRFSRNRRWGGGGARPIEPLSLALSR